MRDLLLASKKPHSGFPVLWYFCHPSRCSEDSNFFCGDTFKSSVPFVIVKESKQTRSRWMDEENVAIQQNGILFWCKENVIITFVGKWIKLEMIVM